MSITSHRLPHNIPPVSHSSDIIPATAAKSAAAINPRKRKRSDISTQDAFDKPFTIQPYPSSVYDKPRTFTPIQLLPRSRLPLSLLDPTASSLDLACGRLFSAHIAPLEGNSKLKEESEQPPMVLIATASSNNMPFAVERVQSGVYALCKLASWVTASCIKELAFASAGGPAWHCQLLPVPGKEQTYWQHAALGPSSLQKPTVGHTEHPYLSMTPPRAVTEERAVAISANAQPTSADGAHEQPDALVLPAVEEAVAQQSAEEIFENLITQYLDALYLSKASLAFFAKGPISRARALFVGKEDGSLRLSDLAAFYRSILLSTTSMDKKYKEQLPAIIKAVPVAALSDDEPASLTNIRSKKAKRKMKLKPGKDGLYPGEAESVKKWWLTDWSSPSQRGSQSTEQIARKSTAELKIRESLMQLVIAMEVMGLEMSPSCRQPQVAEDHDNTESQTKGAAETQPQKKRKAKKKQDVSATIDVLLERLCIWQSVEQGESSSGPPNDNQASEKSQDSAGKPASSDMLKSFCVEVIIPFYVNRIPEKAASISHRLGGPAAVSSAKRSVPKEVPTNAKARKPGEPDVRQPPSKKTRQPLEKAPSETNLTSRKYPTLARSATDSIAVPGLKRERSETPLMSIPRRDSQTPRGGSLADIKRFKNREVDFTAMTAATEAKLRKKAAVENELKNAISALKKPNRGLAVKEIADSADQRRLQRPGLPTRRSFNGVQVTATPKRISKTKNFTQPVPTSNPVPDGKANELAPTSSGACIPSSAVRPAVSSFVPGTERRESRTGLNAAIDETPSRGKAKMVSFSCDAQRGGGESRRKLFATFGSNGGSIPPPLQQPCLADATDRLQSTPKRSDLIPQTHSKARITAPVFATPVKPASASIAVETPTLKKVEAAEAGAETNIYDALGWNDDVDDLI